MSTVFYPMLAEMVGSDDLVSVWSKFDSLPRNIQDILTSDLLPKKLEQLSSQFSFDEETALFVSILVRSIFFQEVDFQKGTDQMNSYFQKKGRNPQDASQVMEFIQKEVMTIVPPKPVIQQTSVGTKKEPVREYVKLPLLKALADYPRLNEQLITAEKIRIKSQPEPARPNLANWIRYYRDELGIGFHDQVTRGKFLFQSENGKKLSADERERIHLVLKSLEEEFPLEINGEQGTIVFPVRTQPSPISSAFPKQSELNAPARSVKPFTPNILAPTMPSSPVSTPRVAEKTAIPTGKTSFFSGTFGAGKNVADDTLHFSTGHVLPSEKQTDQPMNIPKQGVPPVSVAPSAFSMTGISQNRGGALPRSPYSIRPLRMREDTNHEAEAR